MPSAANETEAFRRFLRRVWQEDVGPLLRDQRAVQRKKSARVAGTAAAGAGLRGIGSKAAVIANAGLC